MVFDSRLHLSDRWNTAYNRKRKQEHFELFCEGLLSGENYSSNVTVQMFTMCLKQFKVAV